MVCGVVFPKLSFELFFSLQKHPYIHPVLEVEYLRDTNHVAVIQPYVQQGSLKDMIAKVCCVFIGDCQVMAILN